MATQLVSPVESQPKTPIDPFGIDLDSFWDGATFLPLDLPSRSELLLEKVWRFHEAAFVAFNLKLLASQPALYKQSGLSDCFEIFKHLTKEDSRRLIEDPLFLTWLKRSQADVSKERLSDLKRIMNRVHEKGKQYSAIRIEGTDVEVARFDVDPVIKEACSPNYQFPDKFRQQRFEEVVAYPFSFFKETLALALERIRRAWPEAHNEFSRFVRLVVEMIDGDFTSYSAYDHAGIIFVSTDNSPLVALEEFLIHELGHQILYNVMELDPLVISEREQTHKLPWSDQERDLYGYFHAFFIYTFLAEYLYRTTSRSKREQRRISERLAHILKGLAQAVIDLEQIDRFTVRGRHLFENLRSVQFRLCEI